jgi:hypothetical protein
VPVLTDTPEKCSLSLFFLQALLHPGPGLRLRKRAMVEPLDARALLLDELTPASRAFAERLLRACPQVRWHARVPASDEPPPRELLLALPSPTGDASRDVTLWMERGVSSLGFGAWHTHADLWTGDGNGELIALLQAIVAGRFVLAYDVAGARRRPDALDLRDPEALAEALTQRYAPGRLRLVSWAGTADAEVGLEDVTL